MEVYMILCLFPKYFPKMCMGICEEKLFTMLFAKNMFKLTRNFLLKKKTGISYLNLSNSTSRPSSSNDVATKTGQMNLNSVFVEFHAFAVHITLIYRLLRCVYMLSCSARGLIGIGLRGIILRVKN